MYEHFRNELLTALIPYYNSDEITRIGNILDTVAYNYDFTEKETALIASGNDYIPILKVFLASKYLEGVSDRTVKIYMLRLTHFFRNIQKELKDVEPNDVRLYLARYQMQRKVSNRTLDAYRQTLNGFFSWCVSEEYTIRNPCKNIKGFKYEVTPRKSLTRLELEQVRRACKTKRSLAMIDVLYSTGVRVSELCNMKFSDMNGDEISIIGKGKKYNVVYLNAVARISLNEYLKERKGDSDYIFTCDRKPYGHVTPRILQGLCKSLSSELNIKLTPHILRHTSATLAVQSGMPITQVQKMLGHSSVATTQIYAETSREDVANSHKKYVI